MHWYGVLQGVLLAITSIIILWAQGVVALPLAPSDPESLPIAKADDVPAERAPRQVKPDQFDIFKMDRTSNNQMQQKSDGFRVFAKKLQDDYRRRDGYNATSVPPITVTKGSIPAPKKIHKSGIRLFASPEEPEAPPADAGAGGAEGGADAGAAGGGNKTAKELTVSVEKFVTNEHGEKVYNAWGVTFGDQFFDTRFAPGQFVRLTLNPKPITNYYPKMENLTTVCLNRSTIYNEIKIEKWLMRHVYSRKKKVRPFVFSLRQQLYEKGDSEQCHNESFSDWLLYQECAIRRNQRMEYFIPKYPRHQLAIN
ncbi:uncharacterized protein LOC6530904 [Drosophila yakuba]|uniref:Uncharacterized protein n=1 Tax=Drosophila yakuba TaxID=7245 RepID=B4PB55_DROYA|nr:uncharacterized protein LOC6530904 [Drosophila yakuba]EDW91468.1 uncharacterized protein Dyak_GE12071 [Drosophila yakuba]